MKLSDLKPASEVARRYGVKSIVYGAPGSGKTPLINTAPRPVLLACEPGLLSMRGSTVPVFEAYSAEKVVEFFNWFFSSAETKNFDTLAIDSISHLAELVLTDELKKQKHGMKAYGNMSERVNALCLQLYYLPQKHIVLISKQGQKETGRSTQIVSGEIIVEPVMQQWPFFPGKDLNVKVPHLFDNIFHLGKATITGVVGQVNAIRTIETMHIFARHRTGNLAELEPPNLGDIFTKAMA